MYFQSHFSMSVIIERVLGLGTTFKQIDEGLPYSISQCNDIRMYVYTYIRLFND